MEQPSVQYVRTPDGFDIAYSVTGEGLPLVAVAAVASQISGSWRRFPGWFSGLASRHMLVQYDSRGQGLSGRGLPASLSMSDLELDLAAVVDHLRLTRFVLLAGGGFGHVAVNFAISHPDRVAALLLHHCCINNAAFGFTLWEDLPKENWDHFLESLIPAGLPIEEHLRRFEEWKSNATFEDFRILNGVLLRSSLAGVLSQVRTPTLVMHPPESAFLTPRESIAVAAAIPGARFVQLEGQGQGRLPKAEDLPVIEQFLDSLAKSTSNLAPVEEDVTIGLSRREAEVLRLIAQGLSNQQMADDLVISVRTVERHINHIYEKLGVHNKAQATAYALQHRSVTNA